MRRNCRFWSARNISQLNLKVFWIWTHTLSLLQYWSVSFVSHIECLAALAKMIARILWSTRDGLTWPRWNEGVRMCCTWYVSIHRSCLSIDHVHWSCPSITFIDLHKKHWFVSFSSRCTFIFSLVADSRDMVRDDDGRVDRTRGYQRPSSTERESCKTHPCSRLRWTCVWVLKWSEVIALRVLSTR